MITLNNPLSLTGTVIAGSLMLSACSESGTVTTLDARPSVTIDLPQELLDSTFIVRDNISPTILLSNGASVSMQRGVGDAWSGTINVAPATQYTATVTWAETLNGQELPLASLQQTLEVAADGTVVTTQSTPYTTDIDTDNDTVSNLQERENGTDPFNAPGVEESPSETPSDDSSDQPDTSDTDNTASEPSADEPSADENEDPATGPAQSPAVVPTPVSPEQPVDPTPTTPSAPTTDPSSSDTTPEPPTVTPEPDATPSSPPETPAVSPTPSSTPEAPTEEPVSPAVSEPTDSTSEDTTSDSTSGAADEPPTEPSEISPESEAVIADTVVPRIAKADAPTIDGNDVAIDSAGQLTGEWAAAIQVDSSGAPLLIDNLIIDVSAESPDGTPYRRWAAMHDGDYLYVVVIVDDNGDRQRDSGANLTDDDSLELFLDGDNSKSTSYGNDDFHRIFPGRLPGVDKRSATQGDIAGPNSSSSGFNVTFATGPGVGPRGIRRARYEQDVYELKIDLSSAGIDTDAAFGFELQVNDDDGGEDRDSKWAWKHPSRSGTDVDRTVDDPSTMGTLKLE